MKQNGGWFGVALIFLVIWPGLAWSNSLKQANSHLTNGQYRLALPIYKKALNAIPSPLSSSERRATLIKLSRCYNGLSKEKEARQVFHRALQIDPCRKLNIPELVKPTFAKMKAAWCAKNARRCQLCKCKGPICQKQRKCPSKKCMRRDCLKYTKDGSPTVNRPCPPSKSQKPSAALAIGTVLSSVALVGLGVGLAISIANEVERNANFNSIDSFPLKKNIVDTKTNVQQREIAGQVILGASALALLGGIVSLTVGLLDRPRLEKKKISALLSGKVRRMVRVDPGLTRILFSDFGYRD